MRYVVTQFGVDENFNEYDNPIWEGEADSADDAIEKALWENWTNKEKREFMKDYLSAKLFQLN